MKKVIILFFCILFFNEASYCQDDKLKLDISAEIYSLHLWRGFANGNALSIQPCVELTLNNFVLGSWAAYAINGSYSEIDFYLNYQLKNLKFSLFDYFMPESKGVKNSFFDYKHTTTRHAFDFIVEYDSDNFPFRFLASNIFYGDDRSSQTGKNFYSTYFELGCKINVLNKKTEFIGAITPYESFYADNFRFVMAGIKIKDKINITNELQFPVKVFFMVNPYTENIYFNIGISF